MTIINFLLNFLMLIVIIAVVSISIIITITRTVASLILKSPHNPFLGYNSSFSMCVLSIQQNVTGLVQYINDTTLTEPVGLTTTEANYINV